jgi:uncharacterized membrane protein YhhN
LPSNFSKMKEIKNNWLWAFGFFALVNLSAEIFSSQQMEYFSKPFLMSTLALWFYFSTKGNKEWMRRAILFGLFFSTLGDVLLMLVPQNSKIPFFILGLGAFLLAQLFYSSGFLSKASLSRGFLVKNKFFVLPFLIYLVGLLSILWKDLPSELCFPVSIYGMAITFMALTAFNWKGILHKEAFQWTFLGAILFVLSDSLIAINKFVISFQGAHFVIMLTYIIGQFLIVYGTQKAMISLTKSDF